jgi:two-component system response regulator MtrA
MKKQILLADDDESVRKMVGRVLESAGYEVLHACSGNEAVTKFRNNRPDLVLLDLKMPDQEGWETFDQLSHCDAMVPVIVITAWPNQYEVAVQRGIDALMEKPLDMPVLLRTIQGLLEEPEQTRVHRLTQPSFTTAYLSSLPSVA